jgi:16S rRNA (cytidine1402-2'-O)-methyltransferase
MPQERTRGSIFLIPSSLGEGSEEFYSPAMKEKIFGIACFIAENERTARRFLRSIGYKRNFDNVKMIKAETDDSFSPDDELIRRLDDGMNAGVISEAGAPGVADPGAAVVRWAHASGIRVVPLIGPSSILMALMASGLNGQQFSFHGYLPVKQPERRKKIRELEEESAQKNQTQLFMETPYRNDALLNDLLATLKPRTRLCIASNISLPGESIMTLPVSAWRKKVPGLHRQPTIFAMLAGQADQ